MVGDNSFVRPTFHKRRIHVPLWQQVVTPTGRFTGGGRPLDAFSEAT